MKRFSIFPIAVIAVSGLFTACSQSNGADNAVKPEASEQLNPYTPDATWNAYWYTGKAELTSFNLVQNRYGELHTGTAVNIFVTEDFSKSKHVKLDNPASAGADKLPILKLNQSIKFVTGIYPYSLMQSSFQPVDVNNYPHAVKVTGSVQEWCGMAYLQLNERNGSYQVTSNSYFESEGDRTLQLEAVMQEDAIWNMIRLKPESLPTGNFSILPGALYLRLSHKPLEAVNAKGTLVKEGNTAWYTVEMPVLKRTLTINYENTFPYRILGWEDSYPGFDGKVLTTKATRNKEMIVDYWRTHNNADRPLREQLGLPVDSQ